MESVRSALVALVLAGLTVLPAIGFAAGGERVQRMTKEELRGLLGSPELVILDVRWEGGNAPDRIAGSVFENPEEVASWASKYPKEKKIVLYCS